MPRPPNNSGHRTDSTSCMVYLDPVLLAEIDAKRGDDTRSQFILRMTAKALRLKNYEPRGRGKRKLPDELKEPMPE